MVRGEIKKSMKITIAGRIDCPRFHKCKKMIQDLLSVRSDIESCVLPMVETEWGEYAESKSAGLLGASAGQHRRSPLVYYDENHYIGGPEEFERFCAQTLDFDAFDHSNDEEFFRTLAKKEYALYRERSGHVYCYMDFTTEKEVKRDESDPDAKTEYSPLVLGRVVFELFSDVCPRTVENFRALCTGEKGKSDEGVTLHYLNAPIHRVATGGWIQGGDIVDGSGSKGHSIYGPTFADESFSAKQNGPGTLRLDWLDCKKVVFGRVISGMATIRKIAGLPLRNQRPIRPCIVTGCGAIEGDKEP